MISPRLSFAKQSQGQEAKLLNTGKFVPCLGMVNFYDTLIMKSGATNQFTYWTEKCTPIYCGG